MDGEEMGIAEERERSFKILEKVLGHEVKRRNPKELAFKLESVFIFIYILVSV